MYKFGDIVVYESNSKRYIPFTVLSDIDGVINGLCFEKKSRKYKIDSNKYLKIDKRKIHSKKINFVNLKRAISVKSSRVIPSFDSLSKEECLVLRRKIEKLLREDNFSKNLYEKINLSDKKIKVETKLEPLSSDYHMISMEDLFPNGTGRTKEEFEEDNKNISKKFLLQYNKMINKQH